jgi:hypothetical protein
MIATDGIPAVATDARFANSFYPKRPFNRGLMPINGIYR